MNAEDMERGKPVIQHIVLLKWKPGTTDEQVMEAFGGARDLPNEIPGLRRLTIGRNRGPADHGFTHAISVQLSDEQALERYLAHPARARFNADHLEAIEDQRIEVDVPVDMSLAADPARNWHWGASVGMGLPLEDDL
jgi:hypothetical protein